MQAPSPRYILTRATFIIAAIIAILFSLSFIKKMQRKSAITADLKSICSDSKFFKQFYPEEAQKSLIAAIALMAEANQLGISPDSAIDRGLGIEKKYFRDDADHEEPSAREKIIRTSLRNNYENFFKLGYKADFGTLSAMKSGTLPPIPSGPENGSKPVIVSLISEAIAPGLSKVIANLEIRPPQIEGVPPSDIEIAAAKQLARDLSEAKIIEEPVRDRIILKLTEISKK